MHRQVAGLIFLISLLFPKMELDTRKCILFVKKTEKPGRLLTKPSYPLFIKNVSLTSLNDTTFSTA